MDCDVRLPNIQSNLPERYVISTVEVTDVSECSSHQMSVTGYQSDTQFKTISGAM